MVVLRVIFGILIIIEGMNCIMVPALGAVGLYWMITSFMLMLGIFGIIHYIEDKNREKVAKQHGVQYMGAGAGCLIGAVIAVVLSVLGMTSLKGSAVLSTIFSVLFGLFITGLGITNIVFANIQKKIAAPGWFPLMILGIVVAVLGVVCIFNSFLSFTAMGVMIGIDMMAFGMTMIVGSSNYD